MHFSLKLGTFEVCTFPCSQALLRYALFLDVTQYLGSTCSRSYYQIVASRSNALKIHTLATQCFSSVSRTGVRLGDPEAGTPRFWGRGGADLTFLGLGVSQGVVPRVPKQTGRGGLGHEQAYWIPQVQVDVQGHQWQSVIKYMHYSLYAFPYYLVHSLFGLDPGLKKGFRTQKLP